MDMYFKFIEQNLLPVIVLGFVCLFAAYLLFKRSRGINAAILIEKKQHETADPEFIAEARADAEKEGFLTEFNEALSKKGTPITNLKLILAHQEALKSVRKTL